MLTHTYGDTNVEPHVVDGGEVLFVVDIPHRVRKDLHSGVVGEHIGQFPGPAQAVDVHRGVGHDGMVGHDV